MQKKYITKIHLVSRLGIFIFMMAGIIFLFLYSNNPYILFTSTGFFATAIILIPPAVQKDYSVFSIWSLLGLSVILGSAIRGIYIGIGYPDFKTLDYYYFLGENADYFISASIMMLSTLFFASMGYLYGPVRKQHSFLSFKKGNISIKRLYIFSAFALLISLVSIYLYIQFTGGFNILNISGKRSVINSLNLGAEHRTWQSLKVLASISMLAHLFVFVDALKGGRKKLLKYAFAALLFLVAVFLPFYTSSRNEVFMYAIFTLATVYYVKQKIQWGKLIVIIIIAIVSFQTMSVLRSAKDLNATEVISSIAFDTSILDSLVLNRNGLELAKTAHIINSTPGNLEFQYGKTIAIWLIAPIPRELWNSKPLISPGPIIGTKIYGNRVSGVPPGFIGEMYWNFHLFGIIIGGFLLGWLLKWTNIRFTPSLYSIPVYVFGPMQLGYLIIGTTTGYGIITILIKTLIAILVLRLLTVSKKSK